MCGAARGEEERDAIDPHEESRHVRTNAQRGGAASGLRSSSSAAVASNAPKSIAWRLLLLNPDAAAEKDESGTLGASAGVASNASADLQAATVRFSSAFTTTPDEIVMRPPEGERREMVPDFDPYADIEAHVKRVAKHKYRGWNP